MLTGTASLESLAGRAPTMTSFEAGPTTFEQAEVFQALFELPYADRQRFLPSGLHPTTPPLVVILAWKTASFTTVQARVSCRSGVRPRGFVVSCVADSEEAVEMLAGRWGLPARLGEVRFGRHYDGVDLEVTAGGRRLAAVRGLDPDPLGPGDVQYTVTTTLAHTPKGLRLVQVEPEYELDRVERLTPKLDHVDWDGLRPVHPVSASIAVGAVTVPKLRFVSLPDSLAFAGTEKL